MNNEKWTREEIKEVLIGMLEGIPFVAMLAAAYVFFFLRMG